MNENSKLGLVHVYTGNGKGKTSAALGIAVRAIGHGFRVFMVQFMKMGYTGEILNAAQASFPIEIAKFNVECINHKEHEREIKLGVFEGYCKHCFDPSKFDNEKAREAFETAKNAATSGRFDVVILDEINIVLHKKLLELKLVLDLIREKSPNTELIFTGRNAPQELIKAADYVTEMKEVKHPMRRKILARKGIEF